MAVLAWTFLDLYTKFSDKQFSSPSGGETTDAKEKINEAYLTVAGIYDWTWLYENGSLADLTIWSTQTGTAVGQGVFASPNTTLTVAAATFFPSMVGASVTFDTSETSYVVYSYTSSTVIVLVGDASAEASGDTITVTSTGAYSLPADFEYRAQDPVITTTGVLKPPRLIERSPEWVIELNAAVETFTGYPVYYGIRELGGFDTTIGARKQMVVTPIPNTTVTARMPYRVQITKMTSDTEYPRGGPQVGPLILQAAKMLYESFKGDTTGVQYRIFYGTPAQPERGTLNQAITLDLKKRPANLGPTPPEATLGRPAILRRPYHNVTYSS